MPSMARDPNQGNGSAMAGWGMPIPRGLAVVLLAALFLLVVLRFVFGSIRVEVGTR